MPRPSRRSGAGPSSHRVPPLPAGAGYRAAIVAQALLQRQGLAVALDGVP